MEKYPQILTLLLKRFDFDYNSMSNVKLESLVAVPYTLQRQSVKYELYGMVNHCGSLRGGYYIATIQSSENKTWYEFNDSYVQEAREQPFAQDGTYKSRSVYLLMYRRATESHVSCETNSESLWTDKAERRQRETTVLRELRGDKVGHKGNVGERDDDDEDNRQMEHNQEEEGQVRLFVDRESKVEEDFGYTKKGHQGKKEVISYRTRGEEGVAQCGDKVSSFNTEDKYESQVAKEQLPFGEWRNEKADMVRESKCVSTKKGSHGKDRTNMSVSETGSDQKVRQNSKEECETGNVEAETNTWGMEYGDSRHSRTTHQNTKTDPEWMEEEAPKKPTEERMKNSSKQRQDEKMKGKQTSRRGNIEADKVKKDNLSKRQTQRPVYHGLYNQGATCYLNSVLQVLFMTEEIPERLDPKINTDHVLKELFEDLKKRSRTTRTITAAFGIKYVYKQCDAAECLERILRLISPHASEVFQGQLRHRTTCSRGHDVIEEKTPFWTLPLSITDTHDQICSVERAFELFFQSTSFSGDNKVYCKVCDGETEATSGCDMEKYPQILTLLLKRFDFDYYSMSNVKLESLVAVPYTLQRQSVKYELYGLVNHFGSLRGGHYTATIQSSENKTWYEFNDSYVQEAREQPFAQDGTYKSRSVYLLMYRRATESHMSCETNSESLWTDKAERRQRETTVLRELRGDKVGHKGNVGERDDDDEDNRQMEHNQEEEGQVRLFVDRESKVEEVSSFNTEVRYENEVEKEQLADGKVRSEKADMERESKCVSTKKGSHCKEREKMSVRETGRDEKVQQNSNERETGNVEAETNLSKYGGSPQSNIANKHRKNNLKSIEDKIQITQDEEEEKKQGEAPQNWRRRMKKNSSKQHLDEKTKAEQMRSRGSKVATGAVPLQACKNLFGISFKIFVIVLFLIIIALLLIYFFANFLAPRQQGLYGCYCRSAGRLPQSSMSWGC
ncbi:uncharacterized protein [Centroberyx affinis]|uniref:uncharacterized protein n=1 Tax=Centroberyx affinis TaxID=166261 RepID=UPI003A5C13D1